VTGLENSFKDAWMSAVATANSPYPKSKQKKPGDVPGFFKQA